MSVLLWENVWWNFAKNWGNFGKSEEKRGAKLTASGGGVGVCIYVESTRVCSVWKEEKWAIIFNGLSTAIRDGSFLFWMIKIGYALKVNKIWKHSTFLKLNFFYSIASWLFVGVPIEELCWGIPSQDSLLHS